MTSGFFCVRVWTCRVCGLGWWTRLCVVRRRLIAGRMTQNVPEVKNASFGVPRRVKYKEICVAASVIDTVVNLCKRRGLVYPSGEIYGGTRSAWDYGPLGVELKENIKKQW